MCFYTQQWEEYHTHVLRTFIGHLGITEGKSINTANDCVGILLQIITIYLIGFTNGSILEWKVQDFLPFVTLNKQI